jgi:putative ABC transport system permease protein
LPGLQSAGLTGFLPLTAPAVSLKQDRFIQGRPRFRPGTEPVISLNHVSPDYFKTMGIQMRAGRSFDANDGKEAPSVAIINETIARQFFPNEDPIGHRLLLDRAAPTIVGVAGDMRHSALDRRVRYPRRTGITPSVLGYIITSHLRIKKMSGWRRERS